MPQGKVAVVPDDGLTTRQRRNRPLLVVHTGIGKGKSTAAFGLALRAWNQGWPIGVFQFVKSAKWKVGEENALKALGEPRGEGGVRRLAQDGRGLVLGPAGRRQTDNARDGPRGLGAGQAGPGRRDATGCTCWTSSPTRCTGAGSTSTRSSAVLRDRPGTQHVVITGRNADPDAGRRSPTWSPT